MNENKILNNQIKIKRLPTELLIKDFIHNYNKCNYEYYLFEMINASDYFREKIGSSFVFEDKQSNGECDCSSGNYSLDFKLFGSSSFYEAINTLSLERTLLCPGAVAVSPSKKTNSMLILELHEILLIMTGDDLLLASQNRYDYTTIVSENIGIIKNGIKSYLKVIETPKNILMLFNYSFIYENEKPNDEVASQDILEAINWIFRSTIDYRKKRNIEHDFYVCTIYENKFYLFACIDNEMRLVDQIDVDRCDTYIEICQMIGII